LNAWVSIIALVGWLVLATAAFRAQRVRPGMTVVMALAWGTIFLLVAAVFAAFAPTGQP